MELYILQQKKNFYLCKWKIYIKNVIFNNVSVQFTTEK